jgi:hypothetical protein
MPAPASNAEVSATLHRCLSPDPGARPSAAELRAVLSGRGAKPAVPDAARAGTPASAIGGAAAPASARTGAAAAAGSPLVSDRLELGRARWSLRADRRAHRTRQGAGCASSAPTASSGITANACSSGTTKGNGSSRRWLAPPTRRLVNGEALTGARPLRQGDLIAVGRQAKGIVKLPLTARGVAG